MRAKSLFSFNYKNFIRILFNRINSFSELDDSLVSPRLDEYLKTKSDVEKLRLLLKEIDNKKIKSANKQINTEKNYAKFSNGKSLFFK